MRAIVFSGPGLLAPQEVAEPEPGPGELLLDVAACGVCRTDLQIVAGDIEPRRLPLIPGHQVIARTADGRRVGVAWLGGADGTCEHCLAGRENLCEQAELTGWTRDGGYAERMVAREDFVFPIPDRFDDVHAAPLLCAGIIGYRSLRLSGIQPGQRLGLFGFGSSAHLAIQVAVHRGCDVFVFARSEAERRRAAELGASWTGEYDARPPAPLHAAVTFAPAGAVVVDALAALGPAGTVAINAIHLDGMPAFDYDLLWRERVLRSVANFTREDAREFLEVAADIPIEPRTETFPLEQAATALDRLAAGELSGSAVLVVDE
ncbi:MAG TPA: zinc-dependent alcohol dehydrogenase family protein [Gaiellales bacterium]|nr:zinc-dependent alcohol dehydrogenase family protein [Gaiellales bacterium]